VFHRHGRQVKDFRGAWATAGKAAGMPDLLFHDLRRSAVRNLVSAGVDERVAMMITGHRTRTVFDRYRIVDEDEISAALAKTELATKAAQGRTVNSAARGGWQIESVTHCQKIRQLVAAAEGDSEAAVALFLKWLYGAIADEGGPAFVQSLAEEFDMEFSAPGWERLLQEFLERASSENRKQIVYERLDPRENPRAGDVVREAVFHFLGPIVAALHEEIERYRRAGD
jgi:Phage integrase family